MKLPSLIIKDYNMSQKNGHDVFLSIKNNNETKYIAVVFYSTDIPGFLNQPRMQNFNLWPIQYPY